MEEQIQAFIDYLATRRQAARNTLLAYRLDLLHLLRFVSAERPNLRSWSRVDQLLLQAYLLRLRARAYSAATLARKIAAIKSFYLYLCEQQGLDANPASALDVPPVPRRVPRIPSQAEVDSMLAAASKASPRGYRDRAILEVLYATGLRASELVLLPLEAVDLERGLLSLPANGRPRTCPLSPAARDALRVYLEQGRPALADAGGDSHLFINSRGTAMTRQGVWLILKQCAEQAGISGSLTPNALRHAFAAHRPARSDTVPETEPASAEAPT